MRFFNSKICTRPVSLADAIKHAKEAPKQRSLDDIIASTKAIKTAATNTPVVTASAPARVEEVAVKAPVAAAAKVQVKIAKEECTKDEKEDEGKEEGNSFMDFINKKKKDKKDGKKEEKEASVKLAMKSELDFRKWPAEKVVGAWKAAGSLEACTASVKGLTNDPKMYCGLLRVAAQTANTVIKTAAAKKQQEVKTAAQAPAFKKIAKLTEQERGKLYEYWKGQYGETYAKAMLENY